MQASPDLHLILRRPRSGAAVSTPVEPTCPGHRGHVDAAPALRTAKASAMADFGADWRSFGTRCPTLRVSHYCSHARLASGWPARPLPGGSRTLWIAARG